MRSHEEMPTSGMKWKKLRWFRRSYELRAGERRLGGLEWGNPFGTQAGGEVQGAAWSFRRTGIIHPIVTLRPAGSETEPGVFRYGWTGDGTLHLESGRRYLWRRMSFWGCNWAFLDETGAAVVRFQAEGVFSCCSAVEFQAGGAPSGDAPLLVVLGCYRKVLAEGDAAVVAA